MNIDTHHLSRVRPPRDFNRWVIPAGAIGTAAMWATTIVILALDHDPRASTMETAVFIATSVVTVLTVLYASHYVVHRSMSHDHQILRDDVAELRAIAMEMRGRLVVAAGENRTLLEQVSVKQAEQRNLYWQTLAENITGEGGGAVPFRRRT